MLAGTTSLSKINVSAFSLSAFQKFGWRMPAGVHGTRQKTLAGSSPVAGLRNGFGTLSSSLVASMEMPAANAEGTT
jgi:hypothetical protein